MEVTCFGTSRHGEVRVAAQTQPGIPVTVVVRVVDGAVLTDIAVVPLTAVNFGVAPRHQACPAVRVPAEVSLQHRVVAPAVSTRGVERVVPAAGHLLPGKTRLEESSKVDISGVGGALVSGIITQVFVQSETGGGCETRLGLSVRVEIEMEGIVNTLESSVKSISAKIISATPLFEISNSQSVLTVRQGKQ